MQIQKGIRLEQQNASFGKMEHFVVLY